MSQERLTTPGDLVLSKVDDVKQFINENMDNVTQIMINAAHRNTVTPVANVFKAETGISKSTVDERRNVVSLMEDHFTDHFFGGDTRIESEIIARAAACKLIQNENKTSLYAWILQSEFNEVNAAIQVIEAAEKDLSSSNDPVPSEEHSDLCKRAIAASVVADEAGFDEWFPGANEALEAITQAEGPDPTTIYDPVRDKAYAQDLSEHFQIPIEVSVYILTKAMAGIPGNADTAFTKAKNFSTFESLVNTWFSGRTIENVYNDAGVEKEDDNDYKIEGFLWKKIFSIFGIVAGFIALFVTLAQPEWLPEFITIPKGLAILGLGAISVGSWYKLNTKRASIVTAISVVLLSAVLFVPVMLQNSSTNSELSTTIVEGSVPEAWTIVPDSLWVDDEDSQYLVPPDSNGVYIFAWLEDEDANIVWTLFQDGVEIESSNLLGISFATSDPKEGSACLVYNKSANEPNATFFWLGTMKFKAGSNEILAPPVQKDVFFKVKTSKISK